MLVLVKRYQRLPATAPNRANELVSVLVKLYLPRHSVPTDEEASALVKLSPPRLLIVTTPSSKWYHTLLSKLTIRYQGAAEIRRAKHMSPVPARATLVELPSRANSTIRRPSVPIPSPRQLAVSAQPAVVEVQASPKAIKKEKTRSRVWGLLGIRSKKSKDVLTKAAPPVGYIAPTRAVVQQDQHTLTPSRGKSCNPEPCEETDY